MELKKKVEMVQDLRIIDDVFFEVFAQDIPACQEILRTILEDDQLIVKDVITKQQSESIWPLRETGCSVCPWRWNKMQY